MAAGLERVNLHYDHARNRLRHHRILRLLTALCFATFSRNRVVGEEQLVFVKELDLYTEYISSSGKLAIVRLIGFVSA